MKALSAVLTWIVITLPGWIDDVLDRSDYVTEATLARAAREANQ